MAAQPNTVQEGRLWAQLIGFIEEGAVVPVVGPELLEIRTGDDRSQTRNFYTLVAEALAERLGLLAPQSSGWRALNRVACDFLAVSNRATLRVDPGIRPKCGLCNRAPLV